jgi:TolA-binding protein
MRSRLPASARLPSRPAAVWGAERVKVAAASKPAARCGIYQRAMPPAGVVRRCRRPGGEAPASLLPLAGLLFLTTLGIYAGAAGRPPEATGPVLARSAEVAAPDLQTDFSFSILNNTSAEAPVSAAAPFSWSATTQGVTPMQRTWRLFVWPTFVLAAVSGPVLGQAETPKTADKTQGKTVQEQVEELKQSVASSFANLARDIKAITNDLKSLQQGRTELELKLQQQLAQLRDDLEDLKKRLPEAGTLEDLRSRLAQVEAAVQRLQAPSNRVALSPPAPALGHVVLVNTYPAEILFLINGQAHRLEPGRTLTLNVPAGAVNYEAIANGWGSIRRNVTTLAANETLTLVAR